MYVIVEHAILTPSVAVTRGERLIRGEGAPEGTRVLQFYPATDMSRVICLWESNSVEDVQRYADETLGDSSSNLAFGVAAEQAFSHQPLGIPERSPRGATV